MEMLRSMEARNLYVNCQNAEECYEFMVVSSKNACQIRSSPTLRHKEYFAYECLLVHASTWRDMHVHAVLSLQEARIRLTSEERMAR